MGAKTMIARIKPPLAIAALVLATASAPAPAQDMGWFVGLGIGYLKADDECPGAAVCSACDDKATTWKIFGGYQFNPYLGFELGLSDAGQSPMSEPTRSASASTSTARQGSSCGTAISNFRPGSRAGRMPMAMITRIDSA